VKSAIRTLLLLSLLALLAAPMGSAVVLAEDPPPTCNPFGTPKCAAPAGPLQ